MEWGVGSVFVYGIGMFLGAFGAGLLPLCLTYQPSYLDSVTTFGIGVLIGSAFAIIIPEGINTLLEPECYDGAPPTDNGTKIGPALVAGFAFMLLVDQLCGGHGHGHGHSEEGGSHDELQGLVASDNNVGESGNNPELNSSEFNMTGDFDGVASLDTYESSGQNSNSAFHSLFGLLVHSAVDGIALGAISASGTHETLEFIVFLAIMLHKGPAAFGITSVLLKQRQQAGHIRLFLFVFAMMAPLTAIATWMLVKVFPISAEGSDIGLCLLFSGGTVLYTISVHILPTIVASSGSPSQRRKDVGLMVAGMLLPLMFGADDD